jgi:hypothetical protein
MAGSSANIMILMLITRYYRCISKKRTDGEEVM